MNYSTVKYCDIANGEGVRTSLFVSGCRHRCPACFNPETWDFAFGDEFSGEVQAKVLESLAPRYVEGLTVLGGEPMEPENQEGLVGFLELVRAHYPDKSIWLYTSDVWEQIVRADGARHTPYTERILAALDVVVDGPFVQELHDITLRFRGSSNQRIIDVPKSLAAGSVVPWNDDPVFATHAM